ncbi:hypothetical protein AAMO2058_000387400 [Amorphochlora amoebiformis]
MSYVNLTDADLLLEFAKLLGDFDEPKAEELKEIAESKCRVALIEKGFDPIVAKIVETKKKNALDAAVVMSFAVAASAEREEKEKTVMAIKKALIKNEASIEPIHLLSMLTSLFNTLDEKSKGRYEIYMALAERAKKADVVDWMIGEDTPKRMEEFKKCWDLNASEMSRLLLRLLNLCQAAKNKNVFGELLMKYLESLHESGKETKENSKAMQDAKDWTRAAIIATFKAPFQMAHRMKTLLGLNVVKDLQATDKNLVDLLKMFVEEDFKGYLRFSESKECMEYMDKLGIDHQENLNHFRVFAACKLPLGIYAYEDIRKALEVTKEETVEEAVMLLVLSKKVDAKIDQAQGKIHLRHTAQREFRDDQWADLGEKLRKWKDGVKNVLSSLYKARQM